MENASKALLIAGSILIGVMILSLISYLISVFGGTSSEINNRLIEKDLYQFNVQFTKYQEQKEIRAQDILTICKLIEESKEKYDYNINLIVRGTGNYSNCNYILENYDSFLKEYSLHDDGITPYYFKCKDLTYNSISKIVNNITFELIN